MTTPEQEAALTELVEMNEALGLYAPYRGMSVMERNNCLNDNINSIQRYIAAWAVEEFRLKKVLALQEKNLVEARAVLDQTDPNNPKAMRAATNTVAHFEAWIARLNEEIPALRDRINKGYKEVEYYHTQMFKGDLAWK